MIYEESYRVGIESIDKDDLATNRAIFTYLEDIACDHASNVSLEFLNLKPGMAHWILLSWKLHIFKRPTYNETVLVKTWIECADKASCIRDFEVINADDEVLAIASSRWVLLNLETRKIIKLSDEYIGQFGMEPDKKVFDEPFARFIEPKEYDYEIPYKVERRDIDLNNHVHNLNYLDIAYEIIPADVYYNNNFDTINIEYKKEIKFDDDVKCYYKSLNNGDKHLVVFKTNGNYSAAVQLGY